MAKSTKTQQEIAKDIREISLQGEVFRQLPFATNHYISNYGRLYGVCHNKVLSQDLNGKYARVFFKSTEDNKYHHYQVHRLVCMMFVYGYFDKCEVHHVNTDQRNNCAWNLVPTTPRQHDIIHDQIRKQRKKTA